ncbi:MAG: efflux RND transporter periplasmic adaptor subunit [Ignavibacteriae bacterium]|nr:MAG: efflux RND transporter periplasmic adaptor subunit [Ignavibacteriota bacterium]
MKINKLIIISIVLFAAIVFYSCGKKTESQISEQTQLTNVKVVEVMPKSFTENFNVVGVIKPNATAKISSEEGGLILSIVKDKGDYVSRGQVVARLKKDVENATYESSLAQLELAKLNYEKQEQLYKENATTEVAYRTALLQLEAAEKGLDVIRTHINKGSVRSPISGIVDAKFLNKGEMSAPGVPIISVVDVSKVKISAGVPERHIKDVRLGQAVKITVDVLPGAEFEGSISYIAPSLSNQSRTFEIEIVISNPERILKPEMNASVEIAKFHLSDAIVFPQDYIVDNGSEKYVFVLEGDIAKRRIIETGGREGNAVLITSGLNIGDKLINEGFQSLVDGEKVQVVQ